MVAALLTTVGAALLGTRLEGWQIVPRPALASHLGIELATAVLAALAAFLLSVPTGPRTLAVRWAPVGIATAWTVLLVGQLAWPPFATAGASALAAGLCLNTVVAVAAMPTILLVSMVLRGAASSRLEWRAGHGRRRRAGRVQRAPPLPEHRACTRTGVARDPDRRPWPAGSCRQRRLASGGVTPPPAAGTTLDV